MPNPARGLPLVTILALLIGLAGCGGTEYASTLDKVRGEGVLVVGTEPEFPPFESRDENGDLVGFDIDMAKEIAKELGVQVRFETMAFDSLPTALETGKVDIIISGMTRTAERAKNRDFTEPYFHTRLCLLVGRDSGIQKPSDLGSKRLVVKLGTTGDVNAKRLFPDAVISRLDTEGGCAMQVVTGRADAFLYDQHSVERHHRKNPDTTRALLEPLTDEPYAMALRLGEDEFVAWLNGFLGRFREDGRHARIYETHFGHPAPSR